MRVLMLGGTGLLGSEFKNISDFILSGSEIDIRNQNELFLKLDTIRPDIVVLAAAKTNSVEIDKDPISAIDTNIIGTANVVNWCINKSVRLVYISTDYVYDHRTDIHTENGPVHPFNYYAWTKLGGECSVMGHKNSLIIRTSFGSSEYPYEYAYTNRLVNKDYVDVIAPIIKQLVLSKEVGIINVGTNPKSIWEYAITRNPQVKPLDYKEDTIFTMDLSRLNRFLK